MARVVGRNDALFSRTSIDFRPVNSAHISIRINTSIISDFFFKLMNLQMKFFDTKLIGDFYSVVLNF